MTNEQFQPGMVRRRRSRLIGFVIAEGAAVAALLMSATYALSSSRFSDSGLATSANIVTIVAAAAVAIIPIICFAIAPLLPTAGR